MNVLLVRIVFVAFICSAAYHVKAHVALDFPHGGETFIVGETITLQWHIVAEHETLNWDLFFSQDGGVTWDTLQVNIPFEELSFEWDIPYNLTSQARVRVVQDNVDQNYQDNSADFTIAANTDPPLLDEPAHNIIIECDPAGQDTAIQAWLDSNGGATVTNYCGELVWSHDYASYSNECGTTGNTLVIFTAVDECGMLTTNALMTIADSTPPDITQPATNLVVESNGQGNEGQLTAWLNMQGGAQASDACGNVTWSHNVSTFSDGCGSTGEALVTFIATDECGNTAATVATFMIVDQLVPNILVNAQDLTITCGTSNKQNLIQQWLAQYGGAEAFDVASDVTWSNNYAGLSDGCGATGSASVVFTVTDQCGNSTTTTATVKIEDSTAPLITLPAANSILECALTDQEVGIQQWLANHGGAQATDGCSGVIWEHNYTSLSNGCGASGSANVIFTATDGCGNSSTTSAIIRTEDNVSPVMHLEAQDVTIVCGKNDSPTAIQNWLNQQGGASASDLCGNVIWTHNFAALSDTCGPVGNHTIHFTATDECGHTIVTQAVLTIVDSLITFVKEPNTVNFSVYPNPASDVLYVSYDNDNAGQMYLRLTDAFGKLHWTGNYTTNEMLITVSNYPRGVYILELRTSKGRHARTVVIP